MKKLLCLVLALTMLMSLALISPAAAEDWKFERKIEIVCPWGLGGGADSTIRPMAQLLQQKLGVPVEVRNETGAGGVTGIEYTYKQPADGYTFMLPPHILTYECGYTAGQFPKFKEDVYRVSTGDDSFHFLLPTAETALINLYRGEILEEKDLPKRMFAYTPCYRSEAGTYRASERGMIRGHQFNKVEMFGYTRPEDSDAMLKELIGKACALVEGLGLHYRLSKLAAGDCSASMATTYDIELWIPSMNEYKECSSVSNAHEYQARRGNIRFRRADSKKTEYLHTLNGSGLATSRVIPAIVEQYQQADGSVVVPEVLRPFLGVDVLRKK